MNKRNGDVIVRIVYDGAPEAGKTTNVRQLSERMSLQRRGRYEAPEQRGRRTEFFDWLDFAGGYIDGHRLQCQLLSVPGQSELLGRRRYLLESADAVVFVADAQTAHVASSRAALRVLQDVLGRRARAGFEAGLILQANKQDLPNAHDPFVLARYLELSPSVPCFGAVAERGEGVRETFLSAVRLAVERVRSLILGGRLSEAPSELLDPQILLQRMLESEEDGCAHAGGGRAGHAATVTGLQPATASTPELHTDELPRAPDPSCIPAGCAWPPVRGRSIALAAGDARADVQRAPARWRPTGCVELRSPRGWLLHTAADWRYPSQSLGSEALRQRVREQLALGKRAPIERAWLLAPEAGEFRLWMATFEITSLADAIDRALRADDRAALSGLFADFLRTMAELRRDPLVTERPLPLSLHGLALRDGQLQVLGVPCDHVAEHTAASLWTDLRQLLHGGLNESTRTTISLSFSAIEPASSQRREHGLLARMICEVIAEDTSADTA